MNKTTGWAIKYSYHTVGGAVRTGLLWKCYFGFSPDHLAGYRAAVFETRQLARDAAESAGQGYDRATAVRVEVSVVEVQS